LEFILASGELIMFLARKDLKWKIDLTMGLLRRLNMRLNKRLEKIYTRFMILQGFCFG
jgi:hypothetical protein